MSNDQPPVGGPHQPDQPADPSWGPPSGPAAQPPWGAPPPTQPMGQPMGQPMSQGGTPEYLDSAGGAPMPQPPAARRGGRRLALIAGSVVGLGVLGGAGAWAYLALSGGGPQPAEAMPSDTVFYMSLDMDPSASQKVEAIKTLKKFPGFNDAVDMGNEDDLRRKLYDLLQQDSACQNLDYDSDIAPWLGDRLGVGARNADDPEVYLVVQVNDEKKADAGMTKLAHCAATGDAEKAGDTTDFGWAVADGYAVVSTSDDIAQDVSDDAAKKSLADDADYQKWTKAIGERGIMNMYLSPDSGEMMGALVEQASASGGMYLSESELSQIKDAYSTFKGGAGTIRFADGSMEMEVAGDAGDNADLLKTDGSGTDVISRLPDDTAIALGLRFPDGWVGTMLDNARSMDDSGRVDDLVNQFEVETGLSVPEDIETLFGDSAVISFGGDFDVNTIEQTTDGTGVPIGISIHGDADGIEGVLDKLRASMGDDEGVLASDADGDLVVVAPDADYRASLLDGGSLGDTAQFRELVPNADDASMVFFVNFDADDWLTKLAESDEEARANLEPLSGIAMSTWMDGEESHLLFKLTTD